MLVISRQMKEANATTLAVSGFAKGVYWLEVHFANGKVERSKVVVE